MHLVRKDEIDKNYLHFIMGCNKQTLCKLLIKVKFVAEEQKRAVLDSTYINILISCLVYVFVFPPYELKFVEQ